MDLWATRLLCVKKDPINKYVQNGLVRHYDGIKNTLSGHSSNTTTWYDLQGNANLSAENITLGSGMYWMNNCFCVDNGNDHANWKASRSSLTVMSTITMSVYFNVDYTDGYINVIQYPLNDLLRIGFMPYVNSSLIVMANGIESNSGIMAMISDFGSNKTGITATYNFNTGLIQIYVNGVLTNSESGPSASPYIDDEDYFRLMNSGSGGTPDGNVLWGKMYNAKIYNRILTSAEIKKNYDVDVARFNS